MPFCLPHYLKQCCYTVAAENKSILLGSQVTRSNVAITSLFSPLQLWLSYMFVQVFMASVNQRAQRMMPKRMEHMEDGLVSMSKAAAGCISFMAVPNSHSWLRIALKHSSLLSLPRYIMVSSGIK